ncbi:MAG: hypothetical protein EPN97_04870 [Alphaproteobacteria bacterium]|nr:MAG: hypothetical protein EPN97_04870 [Alphaproteobacteria bacterium]
MTFIKLTTDDKNDYLCNTANVAGIRYDDEIYLEIQKGPRLPGRPGEVKLQEVFRISAGKENIAEAAAELATAISACEKSGQELDLRPRCILTDLNPRGFR